LQLHSRLGRGTCAQVILPLFSDEKRSAQGVE
jgi:two-component system sensor histidine kinase FlrB